MSAMEQNKEQKELKSIFNDFVEKAVNNGRPLATVIKLENTSDGIRISLKPIAPLTVRQIQLANFAKKYRIRKKWRNKR